MSRLRRCSIILDPYILIQDIVILFIVIDPITLGVFVSANTAYLDERSRHILIRRGVVSALIIMLVFAVAGDYIMEYFNITVYDFMIALGIILLMFSIMNFMEIRIMRELKRDEASLVPIATPLIAGPAAISTIIYIKYSHGYVYALTSILINTFLTYVAMASGMKLSKLLGRSGSVIVDKILSLILAALAISIIRIGLSGIIQSIYGAG